MCPSAGNIPPPKNRVGGFSATSPHRARLFASQPLETHWENEPTPTTTASGVSFYGYRFYNPELGRWINRDPIGEMGGRNLYSFLSNRSALGIDYLGLSFQANPPTSDPHEHIASLQEVQGVCGAMACYSYDASYSFSVSSQSLSGGGCLCCLASLDLFHTKNDIYIWEVIAAGANYNAFKEHEMGHWGVAKNWWDSDYIPTMQSIYDEWKDCKCLVDQSTGSCAERCGNVLGDILSEAFGEAWNRVGQLQADFHENNLVPGF